jgi:hypothetical protein
MKLNFKLLLVSVATILSSGFGLVASSLPVAAAQANSVMTLTYEVQTDRQENEFLVLLAKLTQDSGYPLSERNVTFFEKADLFGDANVSIGSAITSAVGIAALRYETRQVGEHTFTVVYGGDDATTSIVVTATLDLQNLPAMDPLSPPVGMEKISEWSMIATGIVVLIVWGLLIGVFFGTVRGITAGSKEL